ncbi:transcription initiation factor TFIID subunit 4 [Savitreella phatthalungensis]
MATPTGTSEATSFTNGNTGSGSSAPLSSNAQTGDKRSAEAQSRNKDVKRVKSSTSMPHLAIDKPSIDTAMSAQQAASPAALTEPSTPSANPLSAVAAVTQMGPPTSSTLGRNKRDDGLDEGDPNDMIGSAGINLLEEERNMQEIELPFSANQSAMTDQNDLSSDSPGAAGPAGTTQQVSKQLSDRRRTEFLHIQATHNYLLQHLGDGLKSVEADVQHLIAMATRERLANLLSRMVVLEKHRTAPPPMNCTAIDDVGRTLRSVVSKEAQEESRRRTQAQIRRQEEEARRREAEEAARTGGSKRAALARGITDTALARNANQTANMMLSTSGGKKYSWMSGGMAGLGGSTGLASGGSSLGSGVDSGDESGGSGPGSGGARGGRPAPYGAGGNVFKAAPQDERGVLTMRDLTSALEAEGDLTFGRGTRTLLRAYTRFKD